MSQRPQVDALRRGVDILVATPGRLLDLIQQRMLTLGSVEVLVVDEADQMLDLGFIVPLRKIVKLVPQKRQTLFFSATMPKTIAELADALLTDPVQVAVTPVATTVERVEQKVMFVATSEKQPLLQTLLADPAMERVLVFTRTKHGADKVVKSLDPRRRRGAGNPRQQEPERSASGRLRRSRPGRIRVLVATDIAARGIHVEAVSHVVNYDLPNVPESYVHRIGRTARAGAGGIALSFCNGEERAFLRDIEKLTRQSIPVAAPPVGFTANVPAGEPASADPQRNRRRGNRSGAGNGQPKQQHARQGQQHAPARARQATARKPKGGTRQRPKRGSATPATTTTGLPAS